MTVEELVSHMISGFDQPEIPRLGVDAYTYGLESLHGVASDCPFPGPDGRCFTSYPVSSALVASFNRSLWYSFGRAMSDEARWAFDQGYIGTLTP